MTFKDLLNSFNVRSETLECLIMSGQNLMWRSIFGAEKKTKKKNPNPLSCLALSHSFPPSHRGLTSTAASSWWAALSSISLWHVCVCGASYYLQVGVQRARPNDLSAGNEPFHINGGRGDRIWARCRWSWVGGRRAAGPSMKTSSVVSLQTLEQRGLQSCDSTTDHLTDVNVTDSSAGWRFWRRFNRVLQSQR